MVSMIAGRLGKKRTMVLWPVLRVPVAAVNEFERSLRDDCGVVPPRYAKLETFRVASEEKGEKLT